MGDGLFWENVYKRSASHYNLLPLYTLYGLLFWKTGVNPSKSTAVWTSRRLQWISTPKSPKRPSALPSEQPIHRLGSSLLHRISFASSYLGPRTRSDTVPPCTHTTRSSFAIRTRSWRTTRVSPPVTRRSPVSDPPVPAIGPKPTLLVAPKPNGDVFTCGQRSGYSICIPHLSRSYGAFVGIESWDDIATGGVFSPAGALQPAPRPRLKTWCSRCSP